MDPRSYTLRLGLPARTGLIFPRSPSAYAGHLTAIFTDHGHLPGGHNGDKTPHSLAWRFAGSRVQQCLPSSAGRIGPILEQRLERRPSAKGVNRYTTCMTAILACPGGSQGSAFSGFRAKQGSWRTRTAAITQQLSTRTRECGPLDRRENRRGFGAGDGCGRESIST